MGRTLVICRTPEELDGAVLRSSGVVFVPTMGALHAGHASLIRQAAEIATNGPVVVSIFVNPTQFNDPADFKRYPQTLDADLELCRAAGATIVFAPTVDAMYPKALAVAAPPLPRVATEPGLEDAKRPGHFAGVCQVVKRLFEIVRPAAAVFGEKDWQQLQVITAMTRELGLPIEIVPGRTVREADGLAMSSRNRFLKPDERAAAASLAWGLCQADRCETVGEGELMLRRIVERAGLEVEYAVIREGASLMPVARTVDRVQARRMRPEPDHLAPHRDDLPRHASRATPSAGAAGDQVKVSLRALIAARLGSVRLIDNAPWGA